MHHIDFILLDTDLRRLWYGAGWNAIGKGLAASNRVRERSLINGRRYVHGRLVETQVDFLLVG